MKAAATIILLLFLFSGSSCQSDTVWVCEGKSSYAYHNRYCEGLAQCRAAVEKISLEKALSMGRKPCHYCYKDAAPARMQKTMQPSSSGLCTAITKKGTRCSRRARSNGYCWQHGG